MAHEAPHGAWEGVLLGHDAFSPGVVASLMRCDALLPVLVVTPRRPEPPAAAELGRARVRDVIEVRGAGDVDELATRLRAAVVRRNERRRPRRVAEEIAGVSDGVMQLRRYVDVAAGSDATVLITGESGTGKELVARAIHRHGGRAGGPFVAVNCAAIPETLLETELFGHEPGAFTDARGRRRGYFEQAAGGTLFLDEIGEMPAALQVKLLRVLQPPPGGQATTREFARVGGEQPVRADVRLVLATHRDLSAEVAAGRFREDLFQRITVLSIRIPPLRERVEDIRILARMFLEQFSAQEGRTGLYFDEIVLDVLAAHSWPRNVRELEAVFRSIVVLKEHPGPVILGDLPPAVFGGEETDGAAAAGAVPGSLRTLDEVEREHVARVMSHVAGNKSRAARILGVSRQALDRKLAAWDEPAPEDAET